VTRRQITRTRAFTTFFVVKTIVTAVAFA